MKHFVVYIVRCGSAIGVNGSYKAGFIIDIDVILLIIKLSWISRGVSGPIASLSQSVEVTG